MLTKSRFSHNQPSSQGSFLLSLSFSLSLAPQGRIGESPGNEIVLPLLISTKIDSLIGLNRPGSKVELHKGRF